MNIRPIYINSKFKNSKSKRNYKLILNSNKIIKTKFFQLIVKKNKDCRKL